MSKKKDRTEMKRRFAKLSSAKQEELELTYHRMKPKSFDKLMSQAKASPNRHNGS